MNIRHWLFMGIGLLVLSGCSNDESYAKKLIHVSLTKKTAVQFVKFTRFDDKNACYEINIRNYDGRQQTNFIALQKAKPGDLEWSHWSTTNSIDECRVANRATTPDSPMTPDAAQQGQ